MIETTIEKIKTARQTVNLEYDEMIEVKKYMFACMLKAKENDEAIVKSDIEYVNGLTNLDPHVCDTKKISKNGLAILCKIFGGYISVISKKRCEENFVFNKPVYEN